MSATLAITSMVLTTEAVTITTQYWEMIPSEFINSHTRRQEKQPHVFGPKRGELLHFVRLDALFECQCQE